MTILPKKKQNPQQPHQNQQNADPHLHSHQHSQRYSYADGPSTSRNISFRDRDEMAGSSGPPTRRQRLGTASNRLSPNRTVCSPSSGGNIRKQRCTAGGTSSNGSSRNVKNLVSNSNPSSERDLEGYNSEDEYEYSHSTGGSTSSSSTTNSDEERKFEERVKKHKGWYIRKMKEDGACLFRAVADQIYGDQEMHGTVRDMCMDYMAKNMDYFSQFVTEDFKDYIARKRRDNEHGNNVEIQAIAEVFNRPVQIYQYSLDPINTFQARESNDNPPISLSYHRGCHYNSVVDPYSATIGIGLGLPQFYPGLAERNLMRDAVGASQKDDIEKTMLEDKLKATDVEATEEQIQEQVARESYLQYMRSREQQEMTGNLPCHSRSASHKPGTPCSAQPSPKTQGSPKSNSGSKPASPHGTKAAQSSSNSEDGAAGFMGDMETASIMNEVPLNAFGITDWQGDADLINQVLAISQQEYWDSQNKNGDASNEETAEEHGSNCTVD